MVSENLSIILKYTGSIIAGFYGIYATLTNFRADKDGKKILTMKGYIGITLLFLSTTLSLSTNAIKDYQDFNDKIRAANAERIKTEEARAREQAVMERLNRQLQLSEKTSIDLAKQLGISTGISDNLDQAATSIEQNAHATQNLLFDTDRVMHPIKDVRFSFWTSVPMNDPHLQSYRNRLNGGIKNLLPRLSLGGQAIDGVFVSQGEDNRPVKITISPGSTLLPDRGRELLAYTVLNYAEIELSFYQAPIKPREFSDPLGKRRYEADLQMSITSSIQARGVDGGHQVEYDLRNGQVRIDAFRVPSDPQFWKSNGKIVGVPDLLSSQVVIRLPSVMVSGDQSADQFLKAIRTKFELDTLVLNLSDGREFWLRATEFKRYVDHNGFPFYMARISEGKSK
jgi:hypothetical protein